MCSTVIADGDGKSINILSENFIYGEIDVTIRREECLRLDAFSLFSSIRDASSIIEFSD